jgi:hypothetical protein
MTINKKIILILSEPRTGSNLLCEALNLYSNMRTVNEFFLDIGFYINENHVPDDLPHKNMFKAHERKQLFDFLNVELDNWPELIKQINKNPIGAMNKINEIVPANVIVVIKVHRDHFEKLNLKEIINEPNIEVILLERSNRLHSFVSLLKGRQINKWYGVDTSDIKVVVDPQEFINEQQRSLNWFKELRELLRSKEYLEINYEKDLSNISKESFYSLCDPWFEKIKLPVNKSKYELKFYSKQDKQPIEHSIINYDVIKNTLYKL